MASCLLKSEYERRTYIKQIGEFQLACDRIWYMGDETEINPEEEAEALTILNETLIIFKERMFMHSLRKSSPIRVQTKSNKVILFAVSDTYWDAWQAELKRRDLEEEEEEEKETAKRAQSEKKEE
ncbi:hypothetical protein BGZ75_005304 [Mortierella antarctica]|nr:hypothetical protein BGZ67_003487 [Mortierella alpina]KAF9983222.1 hypothetical protein BGZ75_005304 [Mortierella antarctica]